MPNQSGMRRRFLQFAGVGTTAAVLAAKADQSAAQTAPGPAFRERFDVRAYGATGDGKSLDTHAINRAIDEAAKAGGGAVIFPAGEYLSYSLHLKSDVSLLPGTGRHHHCRRFPAGARRADTILPSRTSGTCIRISATAISATA